METVESKIRYIAEKLEGVSYMFNNWTRANVELDKIELPAIINLLPVSGKLNLKLDQFRDSPNCLLAFVDLTEYDWNSPDNDLIIEQCKRRAMYFIASLNESGFFEQVEGDFNYSVIYDKLDENITGITIELTLKEIKGICIDNTYCHGNR